MTEGYRAAMEEARMGLDEGGIPIGSALESRGRVIGRGHNLRVQQGDPTAHAEISCLRSAGRRSDYADTVLYTTLAPCIFCTGAVLLFGVPRVVIGEARTFDGEGSLDLLRARGVEIEDLDDDTPRQMLAQFISENSAVWNEDIGR
jgi:cytosine/creatinine deaminase